MIDHRRGRRTPVPVIIQEDTVEFLIGVALALAVALYATVTEIDRDRSFYPVVLLVVASYYDLFAVMGGSAQVLGLEILATAIFVAASLIGFKTNLWLVVAALAGHGVFDLLHSHVIDNPGVPAWWPQFCSGYDIMAAAYLGWRLTRSQAVPSPVRARQG